MLSEIPRPLDAPPLVVRNERSEAAMVPARQDVSRFQQNQYYA